MARLLGLCFVLVLTGPAWPGEEAEALDALAKWMTERHYPNAEGRRFVRVKQGGRTDQEGVFRHYTSYGFVLEEDDKTSVGTADHVRKRESWSDEIGALQKVMSADPDVFVEGTVLVGR